MIFLEILITIDNQQNKAQIINYFDFGFLFV